MWWVWELGSKGFDFHGVVRELLLWLVAGGFGGECRCDCFSWSLLAGSLDPGIGCVWVRTFLEVPT